MRKLLMFILMVAGYSHCLVYAQTETQKKEYEARLKKDSIDGVYIPKDLEDCFKQLDKMWPESKKKEVKAIKEEDFTADAHFGIGMWMRNNWGLWSGSRLSKYFNDMGIQHPDDMSGIILTSYHRKLNNKDIMLEEQIRYYKDYWKKLQPNK
jgi:hypothetical protein